MFIFLFLGLGSIIVALHIPYIQTKIVAKATEILTETIQYPISIKGVNISWFDRLSLEGIEVRDIHGKEMISIRKITANFKIRSLLYKNKIIEEVTIYDPDVKIMYDKKIDDININNFIQALTNINAEKNKKVFIGKHSEFIIQKARIINGLVSYDDPTEPLITNRFDQNHFIFDSLHTSIDGFNLTADTLQLNISNLVSRHSYSCLPIKKFSTQFTICENFMQMKNLEAFIGNSIIRDSVHLTYSSYRQFSYFQDSVKMFINFKNSVLNSTDMAVFVPDAFKYNDQYYFSGQLKGKFNDFTVHNLKAKFGKNSSLNGKTHFAGLPNVDNTLIDLDIKKSKLEVSDLKNYVNKSTFDVLNKFGKASIEGSFYGYYYDFIANATFKTNLGDFKTDLNLEINPETEKSNYNGSLTTKNFSLGKLLDMTDLFQKLDLNGEIEGKGLSLDDADFILNARIPKIGLKGYEYKNVKTDFRLNKQLISGSLQVNDSNAVIDVIGELAVFENSKTIDLDAKIKKIRFKEIGLSDQKFNLSTNIRASLSGTDWLEANGEVICKNSKMGFDKYKVDVDYFNLLAEKTNINRRIRINSDPLDFEISGNYETNNLVKDVRDLIMQTTNKFNLQIRNQPNSIFQKLVSKKQINSNNYEANYYAKLKNISPLTKIFFPEISFAKKTILSGDISFYNTLNMTANLVSDTLKYNKSQFVKDSILASVSIDPNKNIQSWFYFSSDNQSFNQSFETEKLKLNCDWVGKNIDTKAYLKQKNSTNDISLLGKINFEPNKINLFLENGQLTLLDNKWTMLQNNKVSIDQKNISFSNFELKSDSQSISINGNISQLSDKNAVIKISNFNLANLSSLIKEKITGTTNGYLTLKDPYNNLQVEGELNIQKLFINDFLIGDVNGVTTWDNTHKKINTNVLVTRNNQKTLRLTGFYTPDKEKNALEMKAIFNQTSIKIAEPFIKDIFSEMSGLAVGEIKISGSLKKPILKGAIMVKNGRFKINYLNAFVNFSDSLYFIPEGGLIVKKLVGTDDDNGSTILNGGIFFKNFKDVTIDLTGICKKMKILNTTSEDNKLYYGTAYVSGDFNIKGPTNLLKFKANVSSEPGTKIYLPFDGNADIKEHGFIKFRSKNNPNSFKKDSLEKIDLSGIMMDFNFDLNNNTYAEIIFDKQSGDIIKGTGNGKLNLSIDTRGDFTMYGQYNFDKSTYNYTMLDFINKEFIINKGSNISWSGDPYLAQLNISARYDQYTSLKPIIAAFVDSSDLRRTEVIRPYLVSSTLYLKGELFKPIITYGIQIKDYPQNLTFKSGGTFFNYVSAFQSRLQSDEQFLNRQILGLMVFKSFLTDNLGGANNTAGNTISELISNRLAEWASSIDNKLDVGLNIGGFVKDAINAAQLRMSYSLLDGKLKISRQGGFTNNQNQATTASIAGEWTVEYFITSDGRFRIKGFNKVNPNLLNVGSNNGSSVYTGSSLLYTTSFDSFKELFSRFRRKKKKPKNDQENNSNSN